MKLNTAYAYCYYVGDGQEVIEATVTFKECGVAGFGIKPYMLEKFVEECEEVEFDGKIWYEAGGGDGAPYE